GQARVPEAMYCHHCGRQLQIRCPTCSAGNPEDSAFCHRCGTRLSSPARLEAPSGPSVVPGVFTPRPYGVSARISCPRCRSVNDAGSRFCYSCGLPLEEAASTATGGPLRTATGDLIGTPAGFWVRAAAVIVDGVLLGAVGLIIAASLGEPLFGQPLSGSPSFGDVFRTSDRISLVLDAAYYVLGWSVFGTTFGKRVFRLYVVRPDGSKASFWRALWRYIAHGISALVFLIGYLMVAFRKDKRALHDLLADTYVVKR
ncbi:MAG: domain containing protein, partial [Dehalococcoidia bacterium]|nr:domain containing protein [Dehalococcoidia bacterium]